MITMVTGTFFCNDLNMDNVIFHVLNGDLELALFPLKGIRFVSF